MGRMAKKWAGWAGAPPGPNEPSCRPAGQNRPLERRPGQTDPVEIQPGHQCRQLQGCCTIQENWSTGQLQVTGNAASSLQEQPSFHGQDSLAILIQTYRRSVTDLRPFKLQIVHARYLLRSLPQAKIMLLLKHDVFISSIILEHGLHSYQKARV